MSTVIAVANQKGGVGKTTTTIELASCFAEQQRKVLVIDLDQQMNLSTYLGADKTKPSIHGVLNPEGLDGAPFSAAVQRYKDKFDFVRSDHTLSAADVEFRGSNDFLLLNMLCHDYLADEYDYIFIDNSPLRSTLMDMSYVAADYIVVPTECDAGSLEGVQQLYSDIEKKRTKFKNSHAQIVAIVLTKVEKTSLHLSALSSIITLAEDVMEEDPIISTIHKNITVSECKLKDMSLQEYDARGRAACDYRDLALQILKKIEKGAEND